MKNNWMTKMAMSFEAPADAGGGTAVATPPAAAAPAPAPAAASPSSTPAPTKSGFFKDLPRAAAKPDPAAPPAAAKPAAPDASKPFKVMSDDGKTTLGEFASQPEAEAFLKAIPAPAAKPADATPAASAVPDALPRPIMGRFKTGTEVEEYIRQSGQEASRLASEVKTLKEAHQKALADREAEVVALKTEFETYKATPAVKELTKEELVELNKSDPLAATEYIAGKMLRDRDAKAAKEQTERQVIERRQNLVKTNEAITRNIEEMRSNPKTFPKFDEMLPRMSEILARTGGEKSPLRGQVWANELAYKAALGDIYQELLLKGTETQADAAETARLKSVADAAALNSGKGDGGGSGSSAAKNPAEQEDQKWREAVRASAPKPFLKNRN